MKHVPRFPSDVKSISLFVYPRFLSSNYFPRNNLVINHLQINIFVAKPVCHNKTIDSPAPSERLEISYGKSSKSITFRF